MYKKDVGAQESCEDSMLINARSYANKGVVKEIKKAWRGKIFGWVRFFGAQNPGADKKNCYQPSICH